MISSILLQANGAPGGGYSQLLFFALIILVFYFFMIRPRQKKQKQQKKFIEEVKKGDSIVTVGGIHGKIYALDDDTFTLEVDKGVKMKCDRTSISLEATNRLTK